VAFAFTTDSKALAALFDSYLLQGKTFEKLVRLPIL
jgi:hypothetical protein